jgi:amino acid adenylation domain-containing protein
MDNLNKNLSSLSPERLQLLESLLRYDGSKFNAFPLTYGQEQLWFMEQLHPNSSLYNIDTAVALEGDLNEKALTDSLQEIVRRHEVLRSRFVCVEGNPLQVIGAESALALAFDDISQMAATDQGGELQRRLREEASEPFDLSSGPLVRARLIKVGAREHVLQVVLHHIVADGWSLTVLVNELRELYTGYCSGEGGLGELEIQYTDYAQWQREQMGGEEMERQLEYWKGQLGDAPRVLELPSAGLRPAEQTYRGAVERLELSREASAGVRRLSRAEGVTVFMVLLAAFKVLLWRYTQQEDIVVGTVVAGRQQREVEELIGLFVNTVALRTELGGARNYREVLRRVREVVLEAHANQEAPFEKVVEALHPERALSHSPMVQVMFVMQSGLLREGEMGGLKVRRVEVERESAKFDLTVVMEEGEERLEGWIEYSTELYDAATIRRLVEHYVRVVEAVIKDVGARISEIELLSEREREQVLGEWNETGVEYPRQTSVVELFERQVEERGEETAVEDESGRLSYEEVNKEANRLGRYLREGGVEAGELVGVCVRRSKEMVVALLGVLKAGGAYVPLDSRYPAERLGYMVRDAGLKVVISEGELAERVSGSGARVIAVDEEIEAIRGESGANLGSEVGAESLAYVIYTSGSTGHPKGVCISHRGVLNLIYWHQRVYQVTSEDRAPQLAGVSFDASVWELWPYLTIGASIHIPDDETRLSPEKLHDWLIAKRITIAFVPTPLAERIMFLGWPRTTHLRCMLTGGDRLNHYPPELLPFALINNYGPSENTVVTTYGSIPANALADASPPIGRPIDNVQVYLLDQDLRPIPPGIAGELCIGGEGLARGYLNGPESTAERFVPNPFSKRAGERLYRTGDQGCYLANGTIKFIGRLDQQVKLRGYRIELGEIEAVLRGHEAVREAVVVVREEEGEKRLVGYVVGGAGVELRIEEVRRWARGKLPEYMVPGWYVEMERLPLTRNGKVDRHALPPPQSARRHLEASYIAPRNKIEQRVANIWQELLRMDKVGINDNFFDLGGHSLLMVQLHSKLRETFNKKELSIVEVFKHPTVKLLARYISGEQSSQALLREPHDRADRRKVAMNNRLRKRKRFDE